MKHSLELVLVTAILLCFGILTCASALRESLTFDEIVNIEEGLNNVIHHTFLIEPYNPPLVRELAVLPLVAGIRLEGPPNIQYFPARLVIIVLAMFGLSVLYLAARQLLGILPALFSLVLVAFEPSFLAHSHYITPDVGVTVLTFASMLLLVAFINKPTWPRVLFVGVMCGLAFASKIPALFFIGIFFVLLAIFTRKRINASKSIIALLISCIVLWSTFFFTGRAVLVKHDDPARISNRILSYAQIHYLPFVKAGFEAVANTPMPLGDYLELLRKNLQRAKTPTIDFYLGSYQTHQWYMLPILLLLKFPLPLLFLFAEGLRQLCYSKRAPPSIMMYVALPLISIFVVIICSGMAGLVRYALPILPFMGIAAGWGAATLFKSHRWVVIILIVWYLVGSMRTFPHFISYANEIVTVPRRTQLWFSDSNIDWGQSLPTLSEYVVQQRPHQLRFSYFGRDDASQYGFPSDVAWGSYKNNEICVFHTITYPQYHGATFTAMSVSNWHMCGYDQLPEFSPTQIKTIIGQSILIF